jgi:hypothetical protein
MEVQLHTLLTSALNKGVKTYIPSYIFKHFRPLQGKSEEHYEKKFYALGHFQGGRKELGGGGESLRYKKRTQKGKL